MPIFRNVERMRILVTGATGYVGSRLVAELIETGHDVGDASRLRQMAGAVSLAGARPALGLIDAVPGPVAGVLRTGLDMLLGVAKAVP